MIFNLSGFWDSQHCDVASTRSFLMDYHCLQVNSLLILCLWDHLFLSYMYCVVQAPSQTLQPLFCHSFVIGQFRRIPFDNALSSSCRWYPKCSSPDISIFQGVLWFLLFSRTFPLDMWDHYAVLVLPGLNDKKKHSNHADKQYRWLLLCYVFQIISFLNILAVCHT